MKAQDAWNSAYNQLELQLDRATFDTWLRPAIFLGYEDGVFRIGVHNAYAQDMLQHRLYRNVRRVLGNVWGSSVELTFEVHKDAKRTRTNELAPSDEPPLFRFLAQQEKSPDLPETSETQQPSLFEHVQRSTAPPLPDSNLNPRYVYERFMVNKSNQMAYEAALAVAEYPATVYNPFLIYGGVGLGKTHLLQAIAHTCQQRELRTLYVPSEVFTNDLITAIRKRTTAMFREKYRSVDVLLVDDIQFISGKDTTQEEFFHTFNALVNFNKQIVLASDRHPRELKTLEDRLRSRFQGGLVVDIQPPEHETKLAILHMWAQERDVALSPEMIATVARRAPNNIRELEGIFNKILIQSRLGKVSLPTVEDTMERFSEPRNPYTIGNIIAMTAEAMGFTADDLRGKRRTARINKARQMAMYLVRDLTEHSLPQIGTAFGGRSHTTVLHGINKIEDNLIDDRVLEARLAKIRKTIASAG